MSSVCLSVMSVDHDHIDWKSWKLIVRPISPISSLFVSERSSTYSQGNIQKFWGENVRSTPTSITSGWSESTENHVILGGGVAVCLLLLAHHTVIFVIAQLSCYSVAQHWLCLVPVHLVFTVQLSWHANVLCLWYDTAQYGVGIFLGRFCSKVIGHTKTHTHIYNQLAASHGHYSVR